MKEFEYRETKGACRLCEMAMASKMIVIPFRYAGKSAPILLCKYCIAHLHTFIAEKELGNADV